MIRITYFLSGVVQGVGMRFTTLQIAQKFRVAGTVENLDDGRVKIIAEGDSDELGRFIQSVQELTSGRIKTIEQFESEPMHDFIVLWQHVLLQCLEWVKRITPADPADPIAQQHRSQLNVAEKDGANGEVQTAVPSIPKLDSQITWHSY